MIPGQLLQGLSSGLEPIHMPEYVRTVTPPLTPEQRLQVIEGILKERGVVDIKITFAPGFENVPIDELYLEVAHYMEYWMAGKSKPTSTEGL